MKGTDKMAWRFLAALFLLMPVTAEACTAPKWTAQHLKTIPTSGINQALFSEALRMEATYARCRNGNVGELTGEPKLGQIAASQSGRMAAKPRPNGLCQACCSRLLAGTVFIHMLHKFL